MGKTVMEEVEDPDLKTDLVTSDEDRRIRLHGRQVGSELGLSRTTTEFRRG